MSRGCVPVPISMCMRVAAGICENRPNVCRSGGFSGVEEPHVPAQKGLGAFQIGLVWGSSRDGRRFRGRAPPLGGAVGVIRQQFDPLGVAGGRRIGRRWPPRCSRVRFTDRDEDAGCSRMEAPCSSAARRFFKIGRRETPVLARCRPSSLSLKSHRNKSVTGTASLSQASSKKPQVSTAVCRPAAFAARRRRHTGPA